MPKIIWTYIAAAIFSCFVALAVGEGVARLLLPPPQIVTVQPAADLAERRAQEQGQHLVLDIPNHPEQAKHHFYRMTLAGRRMRANTAAIIENHSMSGRRIEIETNSIGYRNREMGAKQGMRLLFLGDSITLGAYLPEEETFVRRVETLAQSEGRNWETINSGVSGISLKTELAILYETGLALEPDVVVLGFYLNDFQESPGVYVQQMPWIAEKSFLFHYLLKRFYIEVPDYRASAYSDSADIIARGEGFRVAMPKNLWQMHETAAERIAQWRGEFDREKRGASVVDRAFYERVSASFDDWGGVWSPHVWDAIEPLFGELKRLSEERGFRVIVLCFPVLDQVVAERVYDEPQRRLAKLAADMGMGYLDLLPVLRGQDDPRGLFYDHCHHTSRGNAVIAEAVYAFLKSN
jgi:hypothetical protein